MQATTFSIVKNTDHFIQQWLKARQEVMVAFQDLCDHRPFAQPTYLPFIHTLCEKLVDYLSLGHFKVFEKVMNVIGSCASSQQSALLPLLLTTTQQLLDFNDKYQDCLVSDHLESDLSKLAEQLAQHLEWEDALIRCYEQKKQWMMPITKIA